MTYQSASGYAGDLLAPDAFELLAGDPTSTLIDVRTQAEWTYVGAPDLSSLGKAALFLEWQSFPSMQVDGRFAARLSTMLETGGLQAGRSPVIPLSIGRPVTPCRNRHDGRGLDAVFQCLGRVRRPFGLMASQERRWRLESGRTALDADLDGLARVRFACRRSFH